MLASVQHGGDDVNTELRNIDARRLADGRSRTVAPASGGRASSRFVRPRQPTTRRRFTRSSKRIWRRGICCRAALDELRASMRRASSSPSRRGRRSSAAPSWRRSAAASPKSARSSSIASARALGIGRALVDELQRARARDGFETLCAFTHDAGYFVRWVLDRAARLGAGENRARLRTVRAVPPLRPARRRAAAHRRAAAATLGPRGAEG